MPIVEHTPRTIRPDISETSHTAQVMLLAFVTQQLISLAISYIQCIFLFGASRIEGTEGATIK